MGYVNINGQQVHTSNISTTSSTTLTAGSGIVYTSSGSNNITITPTNTKYYILGEYFETQYIYGSYTQ